MAYAVVFEELAERAMPFLERRARQSDQSAGRNAASPQAAHGRRFSNPGHHCVFAASVWRRGGGFFRVRLIFTAGHQTDRRDRCPAVFYFLRGDVPRAAAVAGLH